VKIEIWWVRCKQGKNIIINKKKSLEILRVMVGQGEEERGKNIWEETLQIHHLNPKKIDSKWAKSALSKIYEENFEKI